MSHRQVLARLGAFVALVVVLGWPRPAVQRIFNAGFCAVANALFASAEIGRGGRARLDPAPPAVERRPGDTVTADSTLRLTVDGFTGELPVGLSLRRDALLPLVIFLAAMLAAPLDRRARARGIAAGTVIVIVTAIAATRMLAWWMFATQLEQVLVLSSWARDGLDLLQRALLLPPSNRFVGPLLLAVVLVTLARRKGVAKLSIPGGSSRLASPARRRHVRHA
jgi:hypothetical protein